MIGLLELEMLRRPHQVLADFGRDEGLALARQGIEPLDSVLRLDDPVGALIGKAIAALPLRDLRPPAAERLLVRLMLPFRPTLQDRRQPLAQSPTTGTSTRTFL